MKNEETDIQILQWRMWAVFWCSVSTLPGPHPHRTRLSGTSPTEGTVVVSHTWAVIFPHQLPSPAIELHVSGLLALIFLKSDLNWYSVVLL